MAKLTSMDKLSNSQLNVVKVGKRIEGNTMLLEFANKMQNPEAIAECQMNLKKYDEDYKYLLKQRAYYLMKVLEESPKLFDDVISSVLS